MTPSCREARAEPQFANSLQDQVDAELTAFVSGDERRKADKRRAVRSCSASRHFFGMSKQSLACPLSSPTEKVVADAETARDQNRINSTAVATIWPVRARAR